LIIPGTQEPEPCDAEVRYETPTKKAAMVAEEDSPGAATVPQEPKKEAKSKPPVPEVKKEAKDEEAKEEAKAKAVVNKPKGQHGPKRKVVPVITTETTTTMTATATVLPAEVKAEVKVECEPDAEAAGLSTEIKAEAVPAAVKILQPSVSSMMPATERTLVQATSSESSSFSFGTAPSLPGSTVAPVATKTLFNFGGGTASAPGTSPFGSELAAVTSTPSSTTAAVSAAPPAFQFGAVTSTSAASTPSKAFSFGAHTAAPAASAAVPSPFSCGAATSAAAPPPFQFGPPAAAQPKAASHQMPAVPLPLIKQVLVLTDLKENMNVS